MLERLARLVVPSNVAGDLGPGQRQVEVEAHEIGRLDQGRSRSQQPVRFRGVARLRGDPGEHVVAPSVRVEVIGSSDRERLARQPRRLVPPAEV